MIIPYCHPDRKHHSRGLCETCYAQARWRGDFTVPALWNPTLNIWDYIGDRFTKDPDGCWRWSRSLDAFGYPFINYKNKYYRISRVVLAQKLNVPIEALDKALHSCDTSKCINPDHLRNGTSRENTQEMDRKGRRFVKITPDQARFILVSPLSKEELGTLLNVHPGHVHNIRRGVRYPSVFREVFGKEPPARKDRPIYIQGLEQP